ncbi:MAG TPA: DUF3365 domain-containing protein [Stellaceae bacterium]|jgi:hypothetical protein|nr:DUF3365 domain-containing protein [Stellaceae bacterium]
MPYAIARIGRLSVLMLAAALLWLPAGAALAAEDDTAIAETLAQMLRAARTVISDSQARIDDPTVGDKELSGGAVLDLAIRKYQAATGVDPKSIEPQSRQGVLLAALMDSIVEVMDDNQSQINAKGTGFKGFIPAVFGRLVGEAFAHRAKGEAEIKITAPPDLVRNRKARPDKWEAEVIATKLLQASWPRGQPFSAMVEDGRPAFRIAVPEYYAQSCLACHGTPKGEMDKTGYPKEGGKEGDLGAVISITLYH